MHDLAAVDFETFYDSKKKYSLKCMSVTDYVEDDRFEPLCVTIHADDINYVGPVESAPWPALNGRIICAHNARFDRGVLEKCQRMGLIPPITPKRYFCTADAVSYNQCPRDLKHAVKLLYGRTVSKKERDDMDGKHMSDLDAVQHAAFMKYTVIDGHECYGIANDLFEGWPLAQQWVSHLSIDRGLRGVRVDVTKLNAAVEMYEQAAFSIRRSLPWVDAGEAPLSMNAIWDECRKINISAPPTLKKDDPVAAAWEDMYAESVDWVRGIRAYRRIVTALSKFKTLQDESRRDGRYHYSLKYFGAAATGRFSGDEGFNIQNLPRNPYVLCKHCWACTFVSWKVIKKKGVPQCSCGHNDFFIADLRHMLISDDGHTFVIADLAQIEARYLLWRVQDEVTLELIRKGYSVYEAHARATMGWTGGVLKDDDEDLYKYAKARVLGLGYRCGGKRFVGVALAMAGLVLDEKRASEIVKEYRAQNPKIVEHWYWHDRALRQSVDQGDSEHGVELATGRVIKYYDPHWERNEEGKYNIVALTVPGYGKSKTYLHGGVLTNNEIQSSCAAGLGNWILGTERAGIPYVFSVHDEIITQVKDDQVKDAVAEIEAQAQPAFDFAPGCPIGTEVTISKHYLKG